MPSDHEPSFIVFSSHNGKFYCKDKLIKAFDLFYMAYDENVILRTSDVSFQWWKPCYCVLECNEITKMKGKGDGVEVVGGGAVHMTTACTL